MTSWQTLLIFISLIILMMADLIAMSLFFPGQLQRVKEYCYSCQICQLRARERRTDVMPIKPVEIHEDNLGHLQVDLIGPIGQGIYKYVLVSTGVQSRYVTAYELTAPSAANNVGDKIIVLAKRVQEDSVFRV